MTPEKAILIADPSGNLLSALQPFLADKGIRAFHLRSLKETLMNLQDRCADVLLIDSCLLEEDCGFISIIKGISEM